MPSLQVCNKTPSFPLAFLPVCISALTASELMAQNASEGREFEIEEIIVTATKRESTIQDLPFSINAQTQDDIQRTGASNLEDLSRNVAGLAIQNLGPGQSQVAIRGVSAGQIVRDQPGVKEQVGIYLDESVISLSLFTPDLDLFDLNRVETLRGPQGTLFGSGSMGGTIRYITNQPKLDEQEATVEANLHTVTDGKEGGHLKGMANIPLADGKAALRVVAYTTEYAGFIDALGEGGAKDDDVNDGNRTGGRVTLTWEPTDNLTITPRIVFQEIDMEGFNREEIFNIYANPYTTTRPAIDLDEREQYLLVDESFEDETLIADIVVSWGLEPFDVTFVGSYTDREIEVGRDASALTGSISFDEGYPDAGILLPSNLVDTTDLEQYTAELRLSSNDTGDLQWLAGVFWADTEREYSQRLPTPGYDAVTDATLGAGTSAGAANGFGSDSPYNADIPYDLEQFAVFGEVTYDLTERLHLTLGARWYDYEEERSFTSGGIFSNGDNQTDKTDSDGVTPRVMASYDLNEEVVINAQASKGFRLGGVNDPLNAGLCDPADLSTFGGFQAYDDETMWNYELGFKANWSRVTLNAAVFYSDIEDLQVTLDAGSCSSRISFNVPDSHTAGIEFELGGYLFDGMYVSFAGSILEAEFDSTVRDSSGNVVGGVEDGNRLASVPDEQFALAATYTFAQPLLGSSETYLSGSLQYVGDRITQPGDQVSGAGNFTSGITFGGAAGTEVTSVDLELDSYETLNISGGLVYDEWEAMVYINNVTDENVELSFDRERGGRARLAYRTNQPRTIGVTFRKSF
ncbi:TonB-dependent receptor [Maricurvus nonylphenolicus]|uniref:TonB-dependent receptor n=1 Tax=Maricurvus nonylphenolicus TaxID=1008307 RepID=UPI0036F1E9C0